MDCDKYIGRLLDNRYEIQEVIGVGGMAVVYKARCHRLNRLVAIKILKDDYCQDEDFRRRFHAESQAVAMLSHPNIVSVYDVSSSGVADYIVMELIDGISLKQYMQMKGVLNWKETLHFAIQIAKALEHAHTKGIVHRDIKPHNVMVLKNGSVKVTDFGIARVMSKGNTLTKEALGSVHYISPEQAKGGRVDNRSDIYSLGVVMYEMMTGRPPYDGESPVAVAIQHINGGAAMPSVLNPNIPGGLEQIIMKAMAHEPVSRYDTATAMLYDMDEFRKNPSMLFDYNLPSVDAVMKFSNKPSVIELAPPAAKTTAQMVASGRRDVQRRTTDQTGTGLRRPAADLRSRTTEQRRTSQTTGRSSTAASRRRAAEMEAEQRRNKMATITIVVCSVVALIAIGILLATIFGEGVSSQGQEYVYVPSLLGKDYDTLAPQEGLRVEMLGKDYSEDYPEGQIMGQDLTPGDKVVKDTVVRVTVSLGPEPQAKIMVDLVGTEQTIAENFLRNQGYVPLVRQEFSDDVEAGVVIRTEPAQDEPMEEGQTVTIWVSKGPEVVRKTMPNVVGRSVDMAIKVLEASGFSYYEIENVDSDEDKDEVVGQSVDANEKVDVTTVVVLQVSNGPTIPPTTVPPTTIPPTTDATTVPTTDATTVPTTEPSAETTAPSVQETTVEVTWGLMDGLMEDYELRIEGPGYTQTVVIPAGQEAITLTLTGTGTQEYLLYINNEYFNTETVTFTS